MKVKRGKEPFLVTILLFAYLLRSKIVFNNSYKGGSNMENGNIRGKFKYSDLLYMKEVEKIHVDLNNKERHVNNEFERRGMTKSGFRYSKLLNVNLVAFDKLVKFRFQSDLEKFPLPITNIVYQKIIERSESIICCDFPMNTRQIFDKLEREKNNSNLLEDLKNSLANKKRQLSSWVKREIEIHKEKAKFEKSCNDDYSNNLNKILEKIANKLDEINISYNARFNIKGRRKEKLGKLFKVPENKYWFELNKSCNTEVKFKYLVGMLSNLISRMNVNVMKEEVGELKINGSINYLEKVLEKNFKENDTSLIVSSLRRITNIRNYTSPYHPEKPEYKKAINELGLEWPIKDYQYTFNVIIIDFLKAISSLSKILT